MKKLLLILALAASGAQAADDSHWTRVVIAVDHSYAYDFKNGSCHSGVNDSKVHWESCVERSIALSSKTYDFHLVSVDVADCALGFGTLWTLDLNGNVVNKAPVASKGGSVGAEEFDMLCDVYNRASIT